ncbi:E3 ubiquitin-protein ligase Midline-1 [Spatholobus suberectus]|nr:E3 ubiquitin-protein ligase Midline-1 [Spatholobus suberectus]
MNPRHPSPSNCDICGAAQTLSLTIHNIRHRAHNCRYCTNCVLKQHPGLFCPLCFELHDDPLLPPHHRLMCVRCPSVAHRSCAFPSATNTSAAPALAFFCPTCLDANFNYFNLPDRKTGAVDVQSAKVLVAAARIAALSMSKAAAAARFDAERRAREAAVARKRAREALEHLAEILAREQAEQNERNGVVSAAAVEPRNCVVRPIHCH